VTGRPRTSTVVLGATFVLTLVLYLWVRPEPAPPTQLVPAVRVPVETVAPMATTTRPPEGTTTTDETTPRASVPPATSTTTATATSSATTTVRGGITRSPTTPSTTRP
jgi:hypothetical protein